MNIQEKDFCEQIIRFFKDENDFVKSGDFSKEKWMKCANFGLLAISTLQKFGGVAPSYQSALHFHYAMGYGCQDNGLSFAINNHSIVTAGILSKFATNEQKNKYLPKLLNGEIVASYAITDANHGSNSFQTDTQVRVCDSRYVLNGNKIYISNCPIADLFVVIARNVNSSNLDSLYAFIIEKNDDGVVIGSEIPKMGLKGCPMGELILNNCIIDNGRLLGGEGTGLNVSNTALDWERCFEFATHLGTMKRIMEECVVYANARKPYGKSIGSYQAISSKIVQMKIAHENGTLMMDKIGKMRDEGKNTYLESAMFKYYIGEAYVQTALDAMQIHGAYGYSVESGIEQQVRDALAAKIYSGTTEIQQNIIASFIGIQS